MDVSRAHRRRQGSPHLTGGLHSGRLAAGEGDLAVDARKAGADDRRRGPEPPRRRLLIEAGYQSPGPGHQIRGQRRPGGDFHMQPGPGVPVPCPIGDFAQQDRLAHTPRPDNQQGGRGATLKCRYRHGLVRRGQDVLAASQHHGPLVVAGPVRARLHVNDLYRLPRPRPLATSTSKAIND